VTDALTELARAARSRAYCPYSGFAVGAAIEADDGRVFTGCNVESASFGLSLCAERAALSSAITGGARILRRIVIVTETHPPAPPCGACRQSLAEFGLDLVVDAVGSTDTRRWTLRALLPDAFQAGALPARGD
jgi:cytidine deaminase